MEKEKTAEAEIEVVLDEEVEKAVKETEKEAAEETPEKPVSPSKEDEKLDEGEEKPDEDLTEEERQFMGKRAQKRIKTLVGRNKALEARLAEFEEKLSKLSAEQEEAVVRSHEVQGQALTEHEERLKTQEEQAKAAIKAAIEASDPDAQIKALDILTQVKTERYQLDLLKKSRARVTPKKEENKKVREEVTPPKPSKKTLDWVSKNKWFGNSGTRDEIVMSQYTMRIHDDLVQEGVVPDSDEYFEQIDDRIRERFPDYFKGGAKRQTGVIGGTTKPVTTNSAGKKIVKLTRDEMQMADRLGVPYADYAREKLKKAQQQEQGA